MSEPSVDSVRTALAAAAQVLGHASAGDPSTVATDDQLAQAERAISAAIAIIAAHTTDVAAATRASVQGPAPRAMPTLAYDLAIAVELAQQGLRVHSH